MGSDILCGVKHLLAQTVLGKLKVQPGSSFHRLVNLSQDC